MHRPRHRLPGGHPLPGVPGRDCSAGTLNDLLTNYRTSWLKVKRAVPGGAPWRTSQPLGLTHSAGGQAEGQRDGALSQRPHSVAHFSLLCSSVQAPGRARRAAWCLSARISGRSIIQLPEAPTLHSPHLGTRKSRRHCLQGIWESQSLISRLSSGPCLFATNAWCQGSASHLSRSSRHLGSQAGEGGVC